MVIVFSRVLNEGRYISDAHFKTASLHAVMCFKIKLQITWLLIYRARATAVCPPCFSSQSADLSLSLSLWPCSPGTQWEAQTAAGSTGDLTGMDMEGKEVFHIKLSHMAIIRSPPWWVLGIQGSCQPGRGGLRKVYVDKILSSTIAPNEAISQGLY